MKKMFALLLLMLMALTACGSDAVQIEGQAPQTESITISTIGEQVIIHISIERYASRVQEFEAIVQAVEEWKNDNPCYTIRTRSISTRIIHLALKPSLQGYPILASNLDTQLSVLFFVL